MVLSSSNVDARAFGSGAVILFMPCASKNLFSTHLLLWSAYILLHVMDWLVQAPDPIVMLAVLLACLKFSAVACCLWFFLMEHACFCPVCERT